MHTTANLRAITDRVLGLAPPRIGTPIRPRAGADRPIGLLLLLISSLTSLSGLALWVAGLGDWAVRLFAATVLLLSFALRLL